jgi:uncharacterized protein (TIGR02246 family)
MKSARVFFAIAVLATAVPMAAMCGGKATSPDEFRDAVRSTWATYATAVMTGDVAQWMSLWVDDGVKSVDGKPMFIGKDAIQKVRTAAAKAGKYESFEIGITGSYVDQTIGFAYGNYSYILVLASNGATVKAEGKYQTIFRKQADGTWKIWLDSISSNLPAQ